MDGGSEINVLHASTLDEMGIPRSALRPSTAPFHGVVPGIEALPLGQINLPVTFGDVRNFCTETLPSKWWGSWGRTMRSSGGQHMRSLLKIPRQRGIITVGPMYQRSYECDAECFQFAEATVMRTSPSRI
jgi:hypothetical protein